MSIVFIELSPFQQYRQKYLDDEAYRQLQNRILLNPLIGDLIQGTGGLRKLRIADNISRKGTQGGGRVIYYYYFEGGQVWLFHAYPKSRKEDLSTEEKSQLARMLAHLKQIAR